MRLFYLSIIILCCNLLFSCQKHKEQFELPDVLNKSDQIAVASNPLAPSLYLGTLPFYTEIDITEQFFIENNSAQTTNIDFVKKLASTTPINQLEIFIDPRSPVRYSCNQCDIYPFSFFPVYFVNNTAEYQPFAHAQNKVEVYLEFQNDYQYDWNSKQNADVIENENLNYLLIPPKHFAVVLIPYYRTNNAILRIKVKMLDQISYSHLFTLNI